MSAADPLPVGNAGRGRCAGDLEDIPAQAYDPNVIDEVAIKKALSRIANPNVSQEHT